MNSTAPRSVILAAVDRTAATDQVVHTASSLARMIPGSELHLVHVIDAGQPPVTISIPLTETLNEARVFLDGIKERIEEQFEGPVRVHLTTDLPGRYVVQLATDLGADLVVVGTHGKGGLARLLLGSVSTYVANNAPCAVLVARPKEQAEVPKIEPACPKCVETQKASGGEKLWCAEHSVKHPQAHTHYKIPEPFAVGSMLFRPEP